MSASRLMLIGGKDGPKIAKHIADWGSDVAVRESELEEAYAEQLRRSGAGVECQVRIAGVGIADIVADDAVIEVKLWLTRSALFSAIGQVSIYAAALSKSRRVVMGYDAGAPDALVAAIHGAGIEIVSWVSAGGPDWTDYMQADDYEAPEDDGDAEDWGDAE